MKFKNHNYRSGFEDFVIRDLESRKVAFEYEIEQFRWLPPEKGYTPDLRLDNGIYIELKGYLTQQDRVKLKAVKAQHPYLDLRIVFQNARNKLSAESQTTYGQWASKEGFIWAETQIPDEWLEEKGVV